MHAFSRLRESWRRRVGNPKSGSSLETLLDVLPGLPVSTVKQMALFTGKSVSAVNGAYDQLEKAGIVEVLDHDRKSRVFVASEALSLLESLYKGLIPAASSQTARRA